MILRNKHNGLTLLEVLIALSIFAMIGVASYRVLNTVSTTQKISLQHSTMLSTVQKAIMLIDADLQQVVTRDIRLPEQRSARFLHVNTDQYALEVTRAGWSNPLMLSRSSLQRVAYDIGPHPGVDDAASVHYQGEDTYLRRHYWRVLDRTAQSELVTQVLLPGVQALSITVISDKGRYARWPLNNVSDDKVTLKGIELTVEHSTLGNITRLYRIH